jgi:hypothetical protein
MMVEMIDRCETTVVTVEEANEKPSTGMRPDPSVENLDVSTVTELDILPNNVATEMELKRVNEEVATVVIK